MLEQNLLRIVEPYSVVEIEYIAQQVGQGRQAVETKYVNPSFPWLVPVRTVSLCLDRLSQMMVDKLLHGVLDQGRGCLLLFDEPKLDVSVYLS